MKKVLVCFCEDIEANEKFTILTEKFSSKGFEVYLFDRIVDMQLKPHNVLTVLEHVWQEKLDEYEFYFLSNVRDFFKLTYRCFKQSFKKFIFYSDKVVNYDIDLDDIYDPLLNKKIFVEECITKPIYTNDINCEFLDKYLNDKKVDLTEFFNEEEFVDNENISHQLIYRYQEQCFLLEPSSGKVIYINLDDYKVDGSVLYSDIIVPVELEMKNFQTAEEVSKLLAKDYQVCLKKEEVLYKTFSYLRSDILTAGKLEQKYYRALLEVMGEGYGIYVEVFISSFLLQMYRSSFYYKKLLLLCLNNNEINENNKYFVLTQARHIQLFDRSSNEDFLLELESELFKSISSYFKENVNEYFLEFSERKVNTNKIAVVTTNFLDYTNLQSRYVLNICKYLIQEMGKEVWIFNTCEFLSNVNKIPFFDASAGYIESKYSTSSKIQYEETIIPFCQVVAPMPTDIGLAASLEFLKDEGIGLFLNVSELSVLVDIVSTVSSVVTVLPEDNNQFIPTGQYFATNKKISAETLNIYSKYGLKVLEIDSSSTLENITEDNLLKNIIEKL